MLPIFSRRKRPMHQGKYPMHKLKRVDEPTTLIIDDEVRRTPMRVNGFFRAAHGDFGERAATEVKRFIKKTPLSAAISNVGKNLIKAQDGEVAAEVAPISNDPRTLAEHIKSLSYFLDADLTGICEAKDYCWYSHDKHGKPIEPYHSHAIVMIIDQGFDTMDSASGDDWVSAAQSYRAYVRGAEIADIMADYIRRLGYPARAHTNFDSHVQHVPLSLLAGLGEMSRIGEMVVNPFVGPRLKTVVVTTDLPMEIDKPIDFGMQDFCAACKKCARECPCGAIPYGDKIMYNGYETWKPDSEGCTKYRTTNPKGAACGRCMKMCPWNKEGLLHHRLAMWAAIRLPFTRRFLIWLDDKLRYGERNPKNRWWFDLETVDGRVGPAAAVNERGLNVDKKEPKAAKLAVHEPDMWPEPDNMAPVPTDRAEGRRRYAAAESPDAARARLGGPVT